MVGYEGENITETHKALAGAFAGCVSRLLTQPLDVIKVRWQLKKKKLDKPITILNLSRSIMEKEGISAFWKGHSLGQVHSVLAVGSQFYMYEVLSKYLTLRGYDTHSSGTRMLCGAAAGCISCTIVNPLEVIRLRQMLTGTRYRGLISGAKLVYSQGGPRAFYEGLTASWLQIAPAAGISFSMFGLIQPLMLQLMAYVEGVKGETRTTKTDPPHLLIASIVAGSAAGVISKSVTYPLDLVKRRLQIGSHKQDYKWSDGDRKLVSCENIVSCLQKAYEKEGFKGLYRGWGVTIFKAQLTSSIAYGSYEIARRAAAIADST